VLQHQSPGCLQHVQPIHPVVQGVEPESRLLLGLAAQLPPQFGDFQRQRNARFHFRLRRRRFVGVGRLGILHGTRVQAVLLASCGNTFSAGTLRSTDITRLPRYYGPLRLPTRANRSYGFPRLVVTRGHATSGLSGSSTNLSTPAASNHPGRPGCCTRSRLHSRYWLHQIRKAGHLRLPNGTESSSLTLRLTPSFPRASTQRSPSAPPSQLHGSRAFAMVSTFQLTRFARLGLTHRMTPISPIKGPAEFRSQLPAKIRGICEICG